MVEINSEEENEALVKEIKKNRFTERNMNFWIGLSDLRKEGDWRLASNNLKPSYLNWDEEEPNNGDDNEHCAKISDSYRWSELKCGVDMLKNSEFPEITLHALCEFDDLTTTSNSTSSSISNSASKEGAYLSGGMLNFLEVHQYKSKYIFRESRSPCYRYNSFSPCIALTHHLQLHLHVPQKKKEKGRKISTTRGLHRHEPCLRQLEMAGPRL